MTMLIPTVRVKAKNEQGFITINESDFDEKKQELFEEQAAPPVPSLKESIELLIKQGSVEQDGFPSLNRICEVSGNSDLTQEEVDACIKKHFSTLPLHEVVQQLIDKGENLKQDGYPNINALREASGNKELTQEDYDACIKEHFSTNE